ncbi:uncharacterized protein EI90DRAFT_2464846 [Cantharellus anzutake]|uniref:uncharacterized protein n=1 Tax=Cantharellus anzutake TaxID=1750568 RepID=UPI001907124B|nr:uncharacterized protein EI90DRAFT_2464846 [Cantharellus anzutake]KAF8339144.1 hypothetical protein EI90DRAFT_2464846 [Cantharellus anzutake]
MHKLKWIPVEELSRKELNKQKQLINQCMKQNPEFLEQLVEEHGPFPLLWDFNVAARVSDASIRCGKAERLSN